MLTWISVSAALGFFLNVNLSSHYYGLRSGSGSFQSYCNLGEKANCDIVAASPYAEFIAGIPLSSFGAGFMLALLILSLLARGQEFRKSAIQSLTLLSGFGLLISIYYLVVMAFVIKTFCLTCLGVDAVGIVVFALSLKQARRVGAFNKGWMPLAPKRDAAVLALSLLVAIVGLKGLEAQGMSSQDEEMTIKSVLTSKPITIAEPAGTPSIGPKDAKVTIVKFSDFECPFCRIGALGLHTVESRYHGKIRIVFRNYPLDMSCNRNVQRQMHTKACAAARVGLCAENQGMFEKAYEALFERQSELVSKGPEALVAGVGLDENKLKACLSSNETESRLARDLAQGDEVSVTGTPLFFINGYRVPGVLPPATWSKLIDHFLK